MTICCPARPCSTLISTAGCGAWWSWLPARSTYRFKLGARFNGRLGLASAAQARALIRRSAEAAPMRLEPQQPLALSSAAQIYSVVHVTMEASL